MECVPILMGQRRLDATSEDPLPGFEEFPFPGERFTAISKGGTHTCGIRSDGTLACTRHGWPADWSPPEGEFESISVAGGYVCGIRVGGALACSGDSNSVPRSVLSPPAGIFKSVAITGSYGCASRVDLRIVCWGEPHPDYDFGQASPPGGRFRSVAVAGYFSCGLRTDGEVECWGRRHGDPDQGGRGWNNDGGFWPRGPFTALVAGSPSGEICALRLGGKMVCWNDGSATHRAPEGAFVAIDAGPTATCGVRLGGEVECWGFEREDRLAEVYPLSWDPPAGPFTAVSVDEKYACALRVGGDITCWSTRKRGQFLASADEPSADRRYDTRVDVWPGPFTAISTSPTGACALLADGEATCWNVMSSWPYHRPADPPPGPYAAIQVGQRTACGLRPDGDITCWSTYDGEKNRPRRPVRGADRGHRTMRAEPR